MKVKEIMRKDFVSFQSDAKLGMIVKAFAEKGITSAPVFDRGEFLGIVSEGELVRYFAPKKFAFLWIKGKPSPMDEVRKVTAGDLARRPPATFSPDQPLSEALDTIAKSRVCIPVVEGGRVAGLVRGEDIVNFFLVELAKDESKKGLRKEADTDTAMDAILKIVRRDGQVSCRKISLELGISFKTTEKLCEMLRKHSLIDMEYSFLNGPVVNSFTEGPMVRVNENEKK